MDIEWQCEKCGQPLITDSKHVGARINCPKCNEELIVPSVSTSPIQPEFLEEEGEKGKSESNERSDKVESSNINRIARDRKLVLTILFMIIGIIIGSVITLMVINSGGRFTHIGNATNKSTSLQDSAGTQVIPPPVVTSNFSQKEETHLPQEESQSPNDIQFKEHIKKGQELIDVKMFQAAVKEFENAIILKPKVSEGHYYMGVAQYGLGDIKQALTSFEQAVQLGIEGPAYSDINYFLGSSYLQVDKYDNAREFLEKYIEVQTSQSAEYIKDTMVKLARANEKTGYFLEAVKLFESANESGLLDSVGLNHLDKLKRLFLEKNHPGFSYISPQHLNFGKFQKRSSTGYEDTRSAPDRYFDSYVEWNMEKIEKEETASSGYVNIVTTNDGLTFGARCRYEVAIQEYGGFELSDGTPVMRLKGYCLVLSDTASPNPSGIFVGLCGNQPLILGE